MAGRPQIIQSDEINAHQTEELEVPLPVGIRGSGRVVHVHEVIEQRAGGGPFTAVRMGDAITAVGLSCRQWMFDPRGHGLAIRMAGLTACRYYGAHSLEDVSCGTRRVLACAAAPLSNASASWCREELLQPEIRELPVRHKYRRPPQPSGRRSSS